MKQSVKKLWVDELRKPDLKQTTNRLKDETGECCLGVLCRLAVEQGMNLRVKTIEAATDVVTSYDEEVSILPKAVWEWAGLPDYNPEVEIDGRGRVTLATINDNGESFSGIADLIEEQL